MAKFFKLGNETGVSLKVKTALADKEDARIQAILLAKGIIVTVVDTHVSYRKGKRAEHKGSPKPLTHLLQARKSGVMHPLAYGRTMKQLATNLATGNSECPSAYRQNVMGHWIVWEEYPYKAVTAL